jgi:hypothetical protein
MRPTHFPMQRLQVISECQYRLPSTTRFPANTNVQKRRARRFSISSAEPRTSRRACHQPPGDALCAPWQAPGPRLRIRHSAQVLTPLPRCTRSVCPPGCKRQRAPEKRPGGSRAAPTRWPQARHALAQGARLGPAIDNQGDKARARQHLTACCSSDQAEDVLSLLRQWPQSQSLACRRSVQHPARPRAAQPASRSCA